MSLALKALAIFTHYYSSAKGRLYSDRLSGQCHHAEELWGGLIMAHTHTHRYGSQFLNPQIAWLNTKHVKNCELKIVPHI